jgi:hypothetical protein
MNKGSRDKTFESSRLSAVENQPIPGPQ